MMYPCKEPDCAERFDSAADLLTHAADDHGYTIIRPGTTDSDMRQQVIETLGAETAGYDVPTIVEQIQSKYGTCHIDTVPSEEYWEIVSQHTITGTMVSGLKASPTHEPHPGVREIVSRLEGLPGVTYQQIDEAQFVDRTKLTIIVWVTNPFRVTDGD